MSRLKEDAIHACAKYLSRSFPRCRRSLPLQTWKQIEKNPYRNGLFDAELVKPMDNYGPKQSNGKRHRLEYDRYALVIGTNFFDLYMICSPPVSGLTAK